MRTAVWTTLVLAVLLLISTTVALSPVLVGPIHDAAKADNAAQVDRLIAAAWHWSWERHGAPQLNQRFERRAKRRMQGADWAALGGGQGDRRIGGAREIDRIRRGPPVPEERRVHARRLQGQPGQLSAVGQPAVPADPAAHP